MVRKRRKERGGTDEFDDVLVKFVKVTEKCEAKIRLLKAELEEKRENTRRG